MLLCLLLALAAPRNAALQVMAGDGASNGDAVAVEARLWKAFAPVLRERGFALEPLEPLHAYLKAQGIPEEEQHAAGNSPASTARIVRMRELDVELTFMTVLTRDGGEVRLALSAMGYHDLSTLMTDLRRSRPLPPRRRPLRSSACATARWWRCWRLHETRVGRLLAASVASGATLEELDAALQARAAELLEAQR